MENEENKFDFSAEIAALEAIREKNKVEAVAALEEEAEPSEEEAPSNEEAPSSEEEAPPAKEEEEVSSDEEEEEPSEEVSTESELDTLRKINAALMDKINSLSIKPMKKAAAKDEEEDVEPEADTIGLSDEEFDELISNKEKFVRWVNRIASDAAQHARQQILSEVPAIVHTQNDLVRRVEAFFAHPDNQDIARISKYVINEATAIEAAKPGMSVEELLQAAADEVRKSIGLVTRKQQNVRRTASEVATRAANRFPKGTTARRPQNKVAKNDIADAIDALMR